MVLIDESTVSPYLCADNAPDGIMEGWFAVDYFDSNNTAHQISGNFRIKIVQ
jgi:hypothetical protein